MLRALRESPAVLLVDEVDRADDEFEAFLLEVLSTYQVTLPEVGTVTATTPPIVVLTSNRTREVHDALKRRCLYHWIEHPGLEREVAIVRSPGARGVGGADPAGGELVQQLRDGTDLIKPPGCGRDPRLGPGARTGSAPRSSTSRPRPPRWAPP